MIAKFKRLNTSEKLIIGNIYVNPDISKSSVIWSMLGGELEQLVLCKEPVYIGGDFNVRLGNLGSLNREAIENTNLFEKRVCSDAVISTEALTVCNMLEEVNLTILNGRCEGDISGNYTFIGNTGSSTIDYVCCNDVAADSVCKLQVLEYQCHDHQPIVLEAGYPSSQQPRETNAKTIFKWDREKVSEFMRELELIDTSHWNGNLDIDSIQSFICKSIQEAATRLGMARIVKQTQPKDKQWFDEQCKTAKRKVRLAFKTLKETGYNKGIREMFVKIRKEYRQLVKGKKKDHLNAIKNELKQVRRTTDFWNAVRKLRKRKPRTDNPINKSKWEEHLQKLLGERGTDETPAFYDCRHPELDVQISMEECMKAREKMKNGKMPGGDKISNEFLKAIPQNFQKLFHRMFNIILEGGTPPRSWGEIEIVMIHKKGDTNDPSNYRGISLINCAAKWFTQIILTRLSKWAESNSILCETQSGFRKQRG
ncbi:unnamed protein product [Allacma fusca]|uniref:Reverse transcriptase domain-containing protein n=1 Tax=Allacma fusca TaxID=39272 RepID=A0A8J2JL33_9HEXA|nr:unnamed protein product [Allacma fusca]